jgi:hypothetical protein
MMIHIDCYIRIRKNIHKIIPQASIQILQTPPKLRWRWCGDPGSSWVNHGNAMLNTEYHWLIWWSCFLRYELVQLHHWIVCFNGKMM